MNMDQVIEEITSQNKFYIGVMPQSTAATFVRRHKSGTLKHRTKLSFIKKFGYTLDNEATYKKQ